jgi:hypothetical protein
MVMMFGSAEGMVEVRPREWIVEMIAFMRSLDKELTETGELVFQAGLADGSQARTVRLTNGVVTATDGPFAEAKESLIGYWIVDVASEARLIEIASRIVQWSEVVELRPVMDAPPDY